eukprot:8621-Heterococcus_DN1.PRE.3
MRIVVELAVAFTRHTIISIELAHSAAGRYMSANEPPYSHDRMMRKRSPVPRNDIEVSFL